MEKKRYTYEQKSEAILDITDKHCSIKDNKMIPMKQE